MLKIDMMNAAPCIVLGISFAALSAVIAGDVRAKPDKTTFVKPVFDKRTIEKSLADKSRVVTAKGETSQRRLVDKKTDRAGIVSPVFEKPTIEKSLREKPRFEPPLTEQVFRQPRSQKALDNFPHPQFWRQPRRHVQPARDKAVSNRAPRSSVFPQQFRQESSRTKPDRETAH